MRECVCGRGASGMWKRVGVGVGESGFLFLLSLFCVVFLFLMLFLVFGFFSFLFSKFHKVQNVLFPNFSQATVLFGGFQVSLTPKK